MKILSYGLRLYWACFDLFTTIIVYHSQLRSGKLKLARLIDEDAFQRKFNGCIIQCRDYYPRCFIIANYTLTVFRYFFSLLTFFAFLCSTYCLQSPETILVTFFMINKIFIFIFNLIKYNIKYKINIII